MEEFIKGLPKAELHLHIEGAMTADLSHKIASRNNRSIGSVSEIENRYKSFESLTEFIQIYDLNSNLVETFQDFYDIVFSYLQICANENILYAEIAISSIIYNKRNISFEEMFLPMRKAAKDAEKVLGVKSNFILTMIKHDSIEENLRMLRDSIPFQEEIVAIGIAGAEIGNSMEAFADLYTEARKIGYKHFTAHSGEEGDPFYIIDTLCHLQVTRIDHGVRCFEDPLLVKFLKESRIPLTVCPLSNYTLKVLDRFFNGKHIVRDLIDSGLFITINSDDPPLLGGFLNENFKTVADLYSDLPHNDLKKLLARLAQNSFEAAFIEEHEKIKYIQMVQEYLDSQL